MSLGLVEVRSFWSGRRVAITGATGFIGHHLSAQLIQAGADVTALVRAFADTARLRMIGVRCVVAPLEEPVLLTEACRGRDVLFHFAGTFDSRNDWARCRKVNVRGTANVLRAATTARVRRVVHASSIVAIGASDGPDRLDESATWNLAGARSAYATTKYEAERIALAFAGGPEVVVVNPGRVVGPGDFSGSEFGTLCHRFWARRIPIVFGGGTNFVDVRDVATGLRLAAEFGRAGERYILGGANRTYTAFFNDLAVVAGRSIPRFRLPTGLAVLAGELADQIGPPRRGRPWLTAAQARLLGRFFFMDSGKASAELGYRSRPLRESLSDAFRFWANVDAFALTRRGSEGLAGASD